MLDYNGIIYFNIITIKDQHLFYHIVNKRSRLKETKVMNDIIYKTKEEVLSKGRKAIGIPFRDIDETNRLLQGKGGIGNMMEEGWFRYKANNKAEPDFKEAGVELKVTPYIKHSKGISAKERLVCNIINYEEEYNKTFNTSSFWHKNNTMLIMSYEYKKDIHIDAYIN